MTITELFKSDIANIHLTCCDVRMYWDALLGQWIVSQYVPYKRHRKIIVETEVEHEAVASLLAAAGIEQ